MTVNPSAPTMHATSLPVLDAIRVAPVRHSSCTWASTISGRAFMPYNLTKQ